MNATYPKAVTVGDQPDQLPSTSAETQKCPDCAETIQAEARLCRFCGHRFDVAPGDTPIGRTIRLTQKAKAVMIVTLALMVIGGGFWWQQNREACDHWQGVAGFANAISLDSGSGSVEPDDIAGRPLFCSAP